ncbi:DUF616 domain-containing protein [Pseudodesulfovibrio sp. JC047]|uniref:glycosyltransferase domain-containing protein n=1 Tax=Pseudodesulfovibrio sp. JC047 TaxID=2683199 RepID=UPI0013D28A7A|nr:glycosyltransferase domain-containing protein [Pseudodesulfovibrio sp. JC047]NDV20243.1 DUF616 domain-containing protein [Pseudodesulfovibrio sp. JC047]
MNIHNIDTAHVVLTALFFVSILVSIRFRDIAKRNTRRLKYYKSQISKEAHLARLEEYQSSTVKKKNVYYTALTGGYESFKVPEYFDPTFDYYIFTDDKDLKVFEPFKKILLDKSEDDPIRLARNVKLNPYELFFGYEYAVWVDASFLVRNSLEPYVAKVERANADLGVFPHPDRNCYEEEVAACLRKGKDDAAVIEAQRGYYVTKHDIAEINDQPLLVTGIFVANVKSDNCSIFFNAWRNEISRFSRRDQLSSSFALYKTNPSYVFLESCPDLAHLNNKYMFEIFDHLTDTDYRIPDYLPEINQITKLKISEGPRSKKAKLSK